MAPTFVSDKIGAVDDTVSLVLNGKRVVISESYTIHESILQQPATWSIRLGSGGLAAELLALAPPNTPFKMVVGGAQQFTGRTEGLGANQAEGGATEIEIRGYDSLRPLAAAYVKATVGVNVSTYAQLVWYAFQQVGIVPATQNTIDPNILKTDNAANRQLKTGVSLGSILPHRTVQQILDNEGVSGPSVGSVHTSPQAKVGETWHRFIRRYIDRAGLFLWAASDGTFVLSAPDGDQTPTYSLRRRRGQPNAGANVVAMDYDLDVSGRHSEVVIYGRGGGRVLGRVKAKGSFEDEEMQLVYGYTMRPMVHRDVHVHSPAEATFFARRKLAEERRNGWRLEYTVAGHTLPFFGNGNVRAVIVPDTVVSVDDDELGLRDNYYIETVVRRRAPQTTTSMRLMRIEDLLFATPDESED